MSDKSFIKSYVDMTLPAAQRRLMQVALDLQADVNRVVEELKVAGRSNRLGGSAIPFGLAELINQHARVVELTEVSRILKEDGQ